jgi:NADH-quinone oxidoreductase subunit L
VAPESRTSDLNLYTWLASGNLGIDFGVLLDPLSAVMLLVVTGVGFLIHVYSIGYMEDDPGYWRFFSFMNLFIFAMTLLVVADSFLFLLVGWGGVGLASFLLIGFWYTRPSAVAAARKAFVVNVIGDLGLTLAIFLLFGSFGTLAYSGILDKTICPGSATGCGTLASSLAPVYIPDGILIAIALLLFVAAAAKSAQIPLQVWLPDAMEGPTPVSALIHAATMVTAGVYLVARAWPLFLAAPYALPIVGGIAAATALYAASIACVQTDIKRILAYSTMSQIGYMFLGEAARNFSSGIFHLTTHAYFKALLFMAAGAVIHALGGEQDIRKMGGLRRALPWTCALFVVAGLALAAIPPFAGFFSKDDILGAVLLRATVSRAPGWYLLYAVGLLTSLLTGFYIFRLIFVAFLGQYRGGEITHAHAGPLAHQSGGMHGPDVAARGETARQAARDPLARVHEVGAAMRVPMVVLGALSIVGGLYGTPFYNWIPGFLAPVVYTAPELTLESPLLWLSIAAGILASLIGVGIAWALYGEHNVRFTPRHNPLVTLLEHRYYVDDIYDAVFVRPVVLLGQALRVGIEDQTLDGGTRGVGAIFAGVSRGLRALQTGYARNYALAIFLGAALIVLYYLLTFILRT